MTKPFSSSRKTGVPESSAGAAAGDTAESSLTGASAFAERSWSGADLLAAAVLLLAVLLLGGRDLGVGGLGWSDAPHHVFDGIFLYELAQEAVRGGRGWLDLEAWRSWAEQFYIRFPAIGIFVYWPPGFAAVEAAVFGLFGVSVGAARATVLLFAFGAVLLMYRLGLRWFDRPSGLLAALLLLTCPHGVLWLNDVMLEWPATFWLLLAVWLYQVARDRPSRWRAAGWGATLVLAFLTKQTAVFIGPVLVGHALLTRDGRRWLRRPAVLGSLTVAAGLVAAYLAASRPVTALVPHLVRPAPDFLFYPGHLPEIIGWPLLPLVLLGTVTLVRRVDRGCRGLLLLWLGAWTAFCSVISAREPRYFFFALPPLAFAAVRFLTQPAAGGEPGLSVRRRDLGRWSLLSALVLCQTALAWRGGTGRLPSYGPAVAELTRRADADLVLVDAVRDGQFVLDVYLDPDARRRLVPLRASKLLYARAARMQYAPEVFVETTEDIVALLDRYGIRYIVIESVLPRTPYLDADPPPRRLLRRLLAEDPRFRQIAAWPLRCGDPIWDEVQLRLYAYPGCPPRTEKTITLSFPAMGREVRFELPERP